MVYRKKAFLFLLFSLAFILFLLIPGGSNDRESHLEEVLSIGSLEDNLLFQWVGISVDRDQTIFVSDTIDYSLKKFSPKGKMLKKTGRKGQGPGEFLAPRYLDSTEKFIFVSDQYNPKIQVFDKNLNYEYSLPISVPVSDFSVLSTGNIAVATLSVIKSGRIFIFNSKGKVVQEIQYSDEKSPLLMDMVNFEFDSHNNLYIVYNYKDKIEKFDPEGKKLWSKKLLGIKKVKKEKIGLFILPSRLIHKDIALDSSDNIFVLGGSYSKNPSRDICVLDSEGQLLTTFVLPDTSHCIYIDSRDNLYSRANEGVTLKKFKIKY